MNTIFVDVSNVRPAEWRSNHILMPDLRLLKRSLEEYGWLYPLIVRKDDMVIIDGFARWLIASNDKSILVKGKIPVILVDCDEANAIIMHIRLNRARGSIVAKHFSQAIQTLVSLGYVDENQLCQALGMTSEEYEVISQPRFVKSKKLSSHEYSKAWVPIEAPTDSEPIGQEMKFERPPNPDQ